MNELKKHGIALSIIAALVCIKFIFIPVIDWQNTKQSHVVLLEKRLTKVDGLMQREEQILQRKNTLEKQLITLTSDFYEPQNEDEFKRSQQKVIEADIETFNLSMNNIGWNTTVKNKAAPLTEYSVSYSFTGEGVDVINYLLSINAAEKFSETSELNATFARHYSGQIGRMTIRIRRIFYMTVSKLNAKQKQLEETN